MLYLLGTNIVIYVRQNKPDSVLQRFRALGPGDAGISVISYGELIYGAKKSKHSIAALEQLRQLTSILPPISLPHDTADHYGAIRAELETKGQLIGNNDLWIAAHALAAGLTLVTNNQKEFRRVRGLKLENWIG